MGRWLNKSIFLKNNSRENGWGEGRKVKNKEKNKMMNSLIRLGGLQ